MVRILFLLSGRTRWPERMAAFDQEVEFSTVSSEEKKQAQGQQQRQRHNFHDNKNVYPV
jgi:hypothetical protein